MTTIKTDATHEIDLDISGMTCASCAMRIEKRLNKVDGVQATVNYATERAHAIAPASVNADELIAQVAAAGYTAHIPSRATQGADSVPPSGDGDEETRRLRQRVIVSAILAAPVLVLAMVPAF